MSEKHRGIDIGREDAPIRILWIHGYTGSPDAFKDSAERLAKALDARILIPLLPGHGTEEHNLLGHTFADFLESAHHHAEAFHDSSRPFIILGYSFGGYLATILAAEFKPTALIISLTPYKLRFPFCIRYFESLFQFRPFWNKYLTSEDIRVRTGTFYYPDLPSNSLVLIKQGNRILEQIWPKIQCPVLTLHNATDPLARPESGNSFLSHLESNNTHESHILPGGRHALFFRPEHDPEESIVIAFIKKIMRI